MPHQSQVNQTPFLHPFFDTLLDPWSLFRIKWSLMEGAAHDFLWSNLGIPKYPLRKTSRDKSESHIETMYLNVMKLKQNVRKQPLSVEGKEPWAFSLCWWNISAIIPFYCRGQKCSFSCSKESEFSYYKWGRDEGSQPFLDFSTVFSTLWRGTAALFGSGSWERNLPLCGCDYSFID